MNSVILSIIVPFFNVEDYIEECIRSLFNQDVPRNSYEVICINDCSRDRSKEIVCGLQKEYPTILLLELEQNHKPGGARNLGLAKSHGEYVWFIDSDDYIEPNCLGQLFSEIELAKVDVLHFDYKSFYCGRTNNYRTSYSDSKVYSGQEFFINDKYELWWQRGVEVWRRLHRKQFLIESNLTFEENVMFEDTDYSIGVMRQAQSVRHINFSPYVYRINSQSITHRKITPEIIYWKVLQLCRCKKYCSGISNETFEKLIDNYILAEIGPIRESILALSVIDKIHYISLIHKAEYSEIKNIISKKSWYIIKYCMPIIYLWK